MAEKNVRLVAAPTPADISTAASRAAEERQRIHDEAFHAGKRHGDHMRSVAYLASGFILGAIIAATFVTGMILEMSERQQITAGALVDRVLQRTIKQEVTPARPLDVTYTDPDSVAPRREHKDGYAPGERLPNGRRLSAPEPASAPRERR